MRVQLNARNRAYEFEAEPGEKILFAGLRARVDLPYECGTGTCGTCKARLVDGRIDDGWPEAPGRKYLKGAGEFLMCQCAAAGDVTAEVASFVYAIDSGACPAAGAAGVVSGARALTQDVMAFEIELDRPIDFDAGQFMAVTMPGIPGCRGYSMVNFDRRTRKLDFVVKKKPGGGVSEWLFTADRRASQVELFGPLGKATFHPSLGKHLLCIAGGSGIAGMMAILARACQERYFAQFRGDVFFGVRTMADAFYLRGARRVPARVPRAARDHDRPVRRGRARARCARPPAAPLRARAGARGGEEGDAGPVPERPGVSRRAAAGGGRGDQVSAAGSEADRGQHRYDKFS